MLIIEDWTFCDDVKTDPRVIRTKKGDLPSPKLEYDPSKNLWYLLEDYVTPEYTIPKGEFTDGATLPAFAEIAGFHRFDRHLPACIVHDWMYRNAIATKAAADYIFEVNLWRCNKLFGFDSDKIGLMVKAVREYGEGSYR